MKRSISFVCLLFVFAVFLFGAENDHFRTRNGLSRLDGVALPFFDNFEDGNLNSWAINDVEVTASTQNPKNGSYSMKLYDRTTSTKGTGVKLVLNTTSSRVGFEFWEWTNDFGWNGGSVYEISTTRVYTSGWGFNFGASVYTDNNWQYVKTQDKSRWAYGNLWQTNAVDFPVAVPAREYSWHKIKIEIYGPEGKAKFWFDGRYKGELRITPTNQPLKYFNHFISWSVPTTCINYIDDFKAYEIGGVIKKPNWILKSPLAKPSSRWGHAMAYDEARRQVVMFGGYVQGSGDSNETWVWNGANWIKKNPSSKPSPRIAPAMAYDTVRRQVILFGGRVSGGTNSETWVWNGSNWTRIFPGNMPSPRYSHSMAYDEARSQVVLFGGWITGLNNETWIWNGSNWSQIYPLNKPNPRYTYAMAYDRSRGKIILFGGYTGGSGNGETWEWNGNNWTQLFPNSEPSPRYAHAMAYDAVRRQVLLFGGWASDYDNETWEWNGRNWILMNTNSKPGSREGHAMAFDDARQQVVLFGGTVSGGGQSNETWVWK